MFYCYKITNTKNCKVYIGRTNNIRVRWREHLSRSLNVSGARYNHPLSRAIRKYGKQNFKFEVIAASESEQGINSCEKAYIKLYRSNISAFGGAFGYNLTEGGEGISGFTFSDEARSKMSDSHKGLKPTVESLKRRSVSRTGILHTPETKNNLSNMFSGEKSSTAKLTWDIVATIREKFNQGLSTKKELARNFDVSERNIQYILDNKTWRI